jgi:type IV pilus assembly protein PilZ
MHKTLKYLIENQIELNFSYMPFIKGGGLFVPTNEKFQLGDKILLDLILPGYSEANPIEGIVVWITPENSQYSVYAGVGIQLIGTNATSMQEFIKSNLDNTMDVGGYAYGLVNTVK